jgi:gas vesicle protein
MIKTFEQFINEKYNETSLYCGEEYGAPLFNEVSESLIYDIRHSINEGKIVIDSNMIEEGIFDTIGKLFKKGTDNMNQKKIDADEMISDTKDYIGKHSNILDGDDFISMGQEINDLVKDKKVYEKIEEFCKLAEDICAKLSEKEENAYKTINEKLTATNEAIKEFTQKSIAKFKEIVEISKNKISDAIAAITIFCKRMAEVTKKALTQIGNGAVIALALPFALSFIGYKSAWKACEMLVEKTKDGAKIVKEAFVKIKESISNWFANTLKQTKELLKKATDSVKSGAKKAYEKIADVYLYIVAILGQLVSDTKDKISKAYNDFVDCIKDFSDSVKTFVSEKWDSVSSWCKKTSTAFAEGVKNVWDKMKEKVVKVVDSAKGAYKTLKDNANATWNDIKDWNDERQQADFRARIKYAVDKWGKDEVSSWIDEL